MPRSPRRRKGLRLPLLPTGFDGLCWAIIGQQINMKFAVQPAPRNHRTGGREGRRHARPSDAGAGGRYQRGSAQRAPFFPLQGAISDRRGGGGGRAASSISKTCRDGSAVAAEKKLTALRGIGTWTARYVMLRGGFADAAPVGDSALATALQRLHKLPERPDSDQTPS